MAEVHRLPDADRIELEASEWIARLNADDVSPDDRARFEAWRRTHSLHGRVYDELCGTWRAFSAAGPLVRAVSFGQSMNEATKVRASTHRRWWLSAAATLAIAGAGLTWFLGNRGPVAMFETVIGEHASVSLPDGSTLELNSNSLARVNYSEHARIIRLVRGEAYFKVVHDAARPFWVISGGSWVRDLGTAFNVDLRDDRVRVTVTEGTVKVGAAEASGNRVPSDEGLALGPVSVVTAGEEVDLLGASAAVRTLRAADITRTEAWRSGAVYFEKEPLSDVVEELGRYTTLRLIVDDPKLRALPVGGTFQANPQGAEAFLTMLKDGFDLTIRRDSNRVYIESPNIPSQRE
jgi:transmembrane sensor